MTNPASYRSGHPLYRTHGLYIADLPKGVKVGRANDLRVRLLQHRNAGATRACAFPGPGKSPFPYPRLLGEYERTALHLVAIYGGRPIPGTAETFTGITYDDAAQAIEDLCTPRGINKVAVELAGLDAPSIARLTEEPKP